jgi:hypothetical protein
MLRDTQAAFALANKAIKQRAESLPEDRGNNIADGRSPLSPVSGLSRGA